MSAILVVCSSIGILTSSPPVIENTHEAKVKLLFGKQYPDQLLELIKQSKKKIWVSMFVMSYSKDKSYAIENKILEALVKRHKKGVDIRVVLDASLNWDSKRNTYGETLSKKNNKAFQFLKDNGIAVRFDSIDQTMHSKSIIIDNNYLILGSTNWTYSALKKNVEVSALIESTKHNSQASEQFEKLWKASKEQKVWDP